MITAADNKWSNFIAHILKWEGKFSKDPRDVAAARCVRPGQIHTNKGVTFCTFKSMAAILGISPVTYDRFLKLTDAEAARFIYRFYTDVKGSQLPDSIALAMTEAAWMSGATRANTHLRDALRQLGRPVATTAQAITQANRVDTSALFKAYQEKRKEFLQTTLGGQDRYKAFVRGWVNRLNDFTSKFNPFSIFWGLPLLFFLIIAAANRRK
jgi:lysozyme family protein